MRTHLGVAIRDGEIAACLLRGQRRLAEARTTLSGENDWPSLFEDLLGELRGAGRRNFRVALVLSGRWVRGKCLFGVPETMTATDVARELALQPASHFLGRPVDFLTTPPVRAEKGWIAFAVASAPVRSIGSTCLASRHEFVGVLAHPEDGRGAEELAWQAAHVRGDEPHFIDPFADEKSQRSSRRSRARLSLVVAGAAALIAFGPPIARSSAALVAERDLVQYRASLTTEDMETRAAMLRAAREERLAGEVRSRATRMTELLAGLSRSLPDSAAIASLRVERHSVKLVVLSAPSVDALGSVSRHPGVQEARITGTVTRERIGERHLDRLAIAFSVVAQSGSGARSITGSRR